MNTIFEWTITGPYCPLRESAMKKSACHVTAKCNCDTILKAFWEIEEVNSNASYNHMTLEEMSVVKHFERTTTNTCLDHLDHLCPSDLIIVL